MHELTIARSLLQLAETHARRGGAVRVTRLYCRVGALHALDTDLLNDAFEAIGTGTCCHGARIEIERQPLTAVCTGCGTRFAVHQWEWRCSCCGGEGAYAGDGDVLELLAIDAETEP